MKITILDESMDEIFVLSPWEKGKLINIWETLPL